jgi:hypothetical protein
MIDRDESLDWLKGVACIFMVLTHAVSGLEGEISGYINLICGLAAGIFAGVTGVTCYYQSKSNRPTSMVLISYVWLFILGFTLTGIQNWRLIELNQLPFMFANIVQFLFLGSAVFIVLHRKQMSIRLALLFGILIFCVHTLSLKINFEFFPFGSYLFYSGKPSFSLLPWIGFMFIGYVLYKILYKNMQYNKIITSISTIIFVGLLATNGVNAFHKYDMNFAYMALNLSFMVICFSICRVITSKIVIALGKESLLFLYVHLVIIFVVSRFMNQSLFFAIFVTVISVVSTLILAMLKNKTYLQIHGIVPWVILTILPFLPSLVGIASNFLIIYYSIIGTFFALNYKNLPIGKKVVQISSKLSI